jgi:hypothetical protein
MLAGSDHVASIPMVIAFLLLLPALASADWGLRRWGSPAIRRRPRPGGRVTILFLGVCVACALLEFLAFRMWAASAPLAIVILLLQFPAAVGAVLGLDRVMPSTTAADTGGRSQTPY